MTKAKISIRGRVQGVFYRQSARQKASELGLTGWVMNLNDGSVEAAASGQRETIEEFIDWCRSGPPSAEVTSVNVTWQAGDLEFEKLTRFEVR